jgi:transcriptional regulator with XRE-family HTH domain
MKNRILEFLKIENKSSAQFADEIGVQPSSISHILSGRNNPSLDFIVKMINKYPGLSTDWLLFGKGQMYRETQLNDLFDGMGDIDTRSTNEFPGDNKENDFSIKKKGSSAESATPNELKTHLKANKIKSIICFFSNDTFKEYFPGEE